MWRFGGLFSDLIGVCCFRLATFACCGLCFVVWVLDLMYLVVGGVDFCGFVFNSVVCGLVSLFVVCIGGFGGYFASAGVGWCGIIYCLLVL